MFKIIKIGAWLFVFHFCCSIALAHCEIPCGIYDDQARVDLMREHIRTIEKSINKINELSAENPVNYNQLVRWIDNKDLHAEKLQEIISEYFLTQRIKPVDQNENKDAYQKYIQELSLLHQLMVWGMKSEQSSILEPIHNMRTTLDVFEKSYFDQMSEGHSHFGLSAGSKAPDFEALNAQSKTIRLSEFYQNGPVVLVFYRGGWCPYCNLHLKKFQDKLENFKNYNATIVAVSVDTPENAAKTVTEQELGFEIVSNPEADILKEYNLVYKVPDKLHNKYVTEYGIDIEKASGKKHHLIAIPAVFVINKSGKIVFSWASEDYKVRVPPEEVIDVLEKM